MTSSAAERVAERLSDISQIHKCLESPILNVPLPRQVAAMERVLLALQDPIPDNCKDNLIQQIWMGKKWKIKEKSLSKEKTH